MTDLLIYFSFHMGETSLGGNFGAVHPDFDKMIMAPYTEFLHSVFCKFVLLDFAQCFINYP
jgi:hypothetical protein